MVTNDEREKADLRAEIERWRDKAQEAGAAYGNANSKHHAELDRANRLERMADTLAGKAVDLEDRARAAEAKLARVEALAELWVSCSAAPGVAIAAQSSAGAQILAALDGDA